MPDFVPNNYMLKTHSEKGDEDWQIYAWAVHDAMIKASGYDSCDTPLRQKIDYEEFICGRKNDFTAQGKIIRYP